MGNCNIRGQNHSDTPCLFFLGPFRMLVQSFKGELKYGRCYVHAFPLPFFASCLCILRNLDEWEPHQSALHTLLPSHSFLFPYTSPSKWGWKVGTKHPRVLSSSFFPSSSLCHHQFEVMNDRFSSVFLGYLNSCSYYSLGWKEVPSR